MTIDIDAIRKRAERYASAMGPGGEKAWVAGLLAADVPALLAEIQRLTDSEDSRVVVLEAENTRLKEELHQLANDLDAAGEALKATAEGYRFSADAQARMAEMDRLRAENRMLRTKSTRLESENKRLRDELGSARDWEAWENAQAEIKKLRAECVEYDKANTGLGIALAEARAELDRTKPVVDAAEEWYAAFEYEELDDNYSAEERVLFNTIKANPSCPSCGPGGCAGHTKAVAEVKAAYCNSRHAPEGQTYELECEFPAGHKGDHGALKNTVVWFDEAEGEVVCPRCGGADGTHTFRDCKTAARYPHAKCASELPHHSHVWGDPEHWCAGVWTTTAVVAEAALLRQELGRCSTDTTAVERG